VNRKERRAAQRLTGKRGGYLRSLPEGCPNPETDLLFPATGIVTDEDGSHVAALMFPSEAFPRWSNSIAAHAGEWVKGTAYCWLQERTDGRHGGGILLDVLVGTERIFAGIGLLEVPALVDLFTKTGQARLYSDLMRPEGDVPTSPEATALGTKYQGWVPDEAPYMLLQLGEDARRRARMFFEEIRPENARP
jgi:hypothetical protein